MSKLFKRKGFRLASVAYFLSLGTLAVALFAWFSTSSTFSWFASNKDVDATGMAIKVKTDDNVDIDMHVYKYVYNSTSSTYEVKKDPKVTVNGVETIDASLSRYDRVFQEDNDYSPVLLKLTLSGGVYSDNEDLPLKILRGVDGKTLSEVDDTLVEYGDDEKTLNYSTGASSSSHGLSSYISSVVSVKAFVSNQTSIITWDDSNLETSFQAAKNIFESTTSSTYVEKRFVSAVKGYNGATATVKSTNLAFTNDLDYYAGTDGICNVYVWIDYDESANMYSQDGYYGLINSYIDQMTDGSSAINISYPLLNDISQLTIIKES